MSSAPLDTDVEIFILSCINSVEQLEILLLLRTKKELDGNTIIRELRTSTTSVEKRLSDLIRKNLISTREAHGQVLYVYSPGDRYGASVDKLAALYATHRVAIINAIFSRAPDVLKDFSEAFRLKEKDK